LTGKTPSHLLGLRQTVTLSVTSACLRKQAIATDPESSGSRPEANHGGIVWYSSTDPSTRNANNMLLLAGRFDAPVKAIARQISARFPPVVANDPERAVSQQRIQEILGEVFAGALQAERERAIGFLGKARLRNVFRRELRETGYDEKFVDFAAEQFIAQLTRRTG